MSGQAAGVKLPAPVSGPTRLRSLRRGTGQLTSTRLDVRVAGVMLGAIVGLSLFIVLITANRPSLLAPTTHTGFYPHWMSGPLGGLLPGLTQQQHDPALHVHGRGRGDVPRLRVVCGVRRGSPWAGSWRRSCSST